MLNHKEFVFFIVVYILLPVIALPAIIANAISISSKIFILYLSAIPFILLGYYLGEKIENENADKAIIYLSAIASMLLFFKYFLLKLPAILAIFLAFASMLATYYALMNFSTRYPKLSLLISLAILTYLLASYGFPLKSFNSKLIFGNSPLTYIFFFLFSISYLSLLSKNPKPAYIIASITPILTGYRWQVSALFLAALFLLIDKRKINIKQAFLLISIIFVFFAILSWHFALLKHQNFKIPGYLIISYRAAFTLDVFEEISKHAGEGKGIALFTAPKSKQIVAKKLFGYEHSLTYTLLGGFLYDFGLPAYFFSAIFIGFIFAFLKSKAKKEKKQLLFYVFAGVMVTLVETGIDFAALLFIFNSIWIISLEKSTICLGFFKFFKEYLPVP